MSTPLQSLDDIPESNWKEKYSQVLHELGKKEKAWSQEQNGLYKSILRLILSYSGHDDGLDRQLSTMRDRLRNEATNEARNKIIEPVIEEVISFARSQDLQPSQEGGSAEHFSLLLEKLKLPDKYQRRLLPIAKSYPKDPDSKNTSVFLDKVSDLINEASQSGAKAEPTIELKADDPLTQLLENLSLPGDLGIEVMTLRKRAVEIEEDQDRLLLIQYLVPVLSKNARGDKDNKTGLENFPHLKDTLLELFEWLSIPEEYGKRVENVKNRIAGLQTDPELSAVLRDTAIVINDLQAALQVELGDIQNFL
jgi:hypothetical protein